MRTLPALLSIATAAVLGAAPVSAQTVYKCPKPGGGYSFQDFACDGVAGQQVDARPVPQLGGTMIGNQSAAEINRRWALQQYAAEGEPAVGMTREQLDQAMGTPTRVNVSNYGRGREEQRVYERNGRTYYIYTRGGEVSAIQNNEGSVRPQRRNCPSDLDIRNAETSASSTTITQAERLRLQERVRQMRECR